MNIVILARKLGPNYSIDRIEEAAIALGHQVNVLDANSFSLSIVNSELTLTYEDSALTDADAVIPRIGASTTPFFASVLRHFEQQGVFVLNPANSILTTIDKFRSLQILSSHGVPVPDTVFTTSEVQSAMETLGGTPVVIKLLTGTQGVGVMLTESEAATISVVETLHSLKQNLIMQRFVAESRGQDIRAFVIGDKVVGAMRRKARGDEFRSNLHRGGVSERVDIEPAYEEAAVRAADALGLRVAGVDMLLSKDGPKVVEVNASPGLEGIERCSGLDIASMIIQALPLVGQER